MRQERTITIDGQVHTVVIADEKRALLDAAAAGRAVIGIWDRRKPSQDLSPAQYLAERLEDVDGPYLERVVRRHLGLPWIIGETARLLIREFTMDDISQVVREKGDTPADRVFQTPEQLQEYIRCQYGFCQYGIWAVKRRSDGRLVGKAGVSDFAPGGLLPGAELGYHIFAPYRGRGYATEACREILTYAAIHLDCPIYAKIDASNEASIRVAARCGLQPIRQICSESGRCSYLYSWSC